MARPRPFDRPPGARPLPLHPEPEGELPTRPGRLARPLYALLVAIPVTLAALVLLVRAGVVGDPQREGETPWDLAVVLLGCGVTLAVGFGFARRAPELRRRASGIAFDRRRARIELATLVVALPLALALATLALLAWGGLLPALPGLAADPMAPPLLAALAVLAAGAPTALFHTLQDARTRAMEERFPDLLRDLNESHAAGMTMAQAIRVAARGDYGPLTPEVHLMARQVSWGVGFEETFRMMAERVPTPLVTRAVALLLKATRAGGNVKDVLAAAARDAREVKGLERERRTGMSLYVIVIYVAFGVFLAVTAALQGLLVPSVLDATRGVPGIGSVTFSQAMELGDFRQLYFGVGLVQAVGSGIVAGVMGEGSVRAGLKHATIMTALAVVVLGLLL